MKNVDGQPMATYRLQFNREFRLEDARELVPYLSRLGVTHLYASPILRAREGSTHGYDVLDPATINPEVGAETELIHLAADLGRLGMGILLDIVPNHMAANFGNPYWRDVLAYGPGSPFASWFDINWRLPDPEMWGRVLLPVLGAPLPDILKQDEICLVWADGRFRVEYYDNYFPVDPSTVPAICSPWLQELEEQLGPDHSSLERFREILGQLKALPGIRRRLHRRGEIDRNQTEEWLGQLAQLIIQSPRIEEWMRQTAEKFGQGEEGRHRLKALLDEQPYRLVYWRRAARTINYRRFFDINDLISIRQEDPQVFQDTHGTVLRWIEDGVIDGLRIDHVDGLRDPRGYLERLHEAVSGVTRGSRTIPVFVEKILAPDEPLPEDWPVEGTSGYEFLNEVEAILISPEGFDRIEREYQRMVRGPGFDAVARRGKRRILRNDLSAQVRLLADTLMRIQHRALEVMPNYGAEVTATPAGDSEADHMAGRWRPSRRGLADAIVEVIVGLPVYRTYVDNERRTVGDQDRHFLERALESARNGGHASPEDVDLLGEVLLLKGENLTDDELSQRVNFIQRFQQLTGPAAAKGIEDTALYSWVPLVSLNEVGGEPHLPEDPAAALTEANEERARIWPRNMLGVTTHDTKRTADVRARLDVLSEMPEDWWRLVRRWRRAHKPYRTPKKGRSAPDAATEYLFYQTVIGIWPAPDPSDPNRLPVHEIMTDLCARVDQYMLKAIREAKAHTSWTTQNENYEAAVSAFVHHLMGEERDQGAAFLKDVQTLVARIVRTGFWNSLTRTVIQFTSPGTPDLYQGDELWNYALVDPDNRRPVDFGERQRLLEEVIRATDTQEAPREFLRELVELPEDGRIKLHVIHTLLRARRDFPGIFTGGSCEPLEIEGPLADHLFGYIRSGEDATALILVPRLTTSLVKQPSEAPVGSGTWSEENLIHLPDSLKHRSWENLLTRGQLAPSSQILVAELLEHFPVAVMLGRRLRYSAQASSAEIDTLLHGAAPSSPP